MPIFRINSDLHYFCHIPKCGGASVEAYLAKRYGDLAFLNSKFYRVDEPHRWTKTSPQHADTASISLLFPKGWIKSSFAVVRHPVRRVRSAFDYYLASSGTTQDELDINQWIKTWDETQTDDPFQFDNHMRPASDLILPKSKIFRLEDGLDPIVPYLDKLEGKIGKDRNIGHENKSRGGTQYISKQKPLTDASLNRIERLFAQDFKKFGYDCVDASPKAPTTDAVKPRSIKARLFGR